MRVGREMSGNVVGPFGSPCMQQASDLGQAGQPSLQNAATRTLQAALNIQNKVPNRSAPHAQFCFWALALFVAEWL